MGVESSNQRDRGPDKLKPKKTAAALAKLKAANDIKLKSEYKDIVPTLIKKTDRAKRGKKFEVLFNREEIPKHKLLVLLTDIPAEYLDKSKEDIIRYATANTITVQTKHFTH